MLQNVAAVLLDGAHPFELGVICEVFGIDRSDEGLPGTTSRWSPRRAPRWAPTSAG